MSRASTEIQEMSDTIKAAVRNEKFSYEQLRIMLIEQISLMNINTMEDMLKAVSVDINDLSN